MRNILLVLLYMAIGSTSIAQQRIAVVNTADSTMYYEYVAATIFGNSDDIIPCEFNSAVYAEDVLTYVLKMNYEVTKIDMPLKLQKDHRGQGIEDWVKSLNDTYDKVIILSSSDFLDSEHNTNAVLSGSGLYSRMGLRAEIYSTFYYSMYNTDNGKCIDINCLKFKRIREYCYSEIKNIFNPTMCDFVIRELKIFIRENILCGLQPFNLYTKNELNAILNYWAFKPTPYIELAYRENIKDSMLITGWYYTIDHDNGFKRTLDKSEDTFFIDPTPIVTKENFSTVEVYQTDFKGMRPDIVGLNTILDDYGRTAFAFATFKSYDRHIVLVINNKIVSALFIKSVLNDGSPYLQRKEYNLSEIQAFAKVMSANEL